MCTVYISPTEACETGKKVVDTEVEQPDSKIVLHCTLKVILLIRVHAKGEGRKSCFTAFEERRLRLHRASFSARLKEEMERFFQQLHQLDAKPGGLAA